MSLAPCAETQIQAEHQQRCFAIPVCSDDFYVACDWIENGTGSALRFKFFWGNVVWRLNEVEEMLPEKGIWIPVTVSRDLLLREPDSSFEDPLWAQYALKAGGELKELGERFGLFPPQD
eukprot:symbB.v1.2.032498.t1/scaffold3908.1/size48452/4